MFLYQGGISSQKRELEFFLRGNKKEVNHKEDLFSFLFLTDNLISDWQEEQLVQHLQEQECYF